MTSWCADYNVPGGPHPVEQAHAVRQASALLTFMCTGAGGRGQDMCDSHQRHDTPHCSAGHG